MLYYSLIYPFLIYASPIWGNTHNIHLIHKLQKKVVRLITFNNSYIKPPSDPLFNTLNILTIYDIFKSETLKFVYNCLNKTNPMQFHGFFHFQNTIHNTVNVRDDNLDPPQVRTTTYGLKSLKYVGVILWNSLPLFIRSKKSLKTFGNGIKERYIKSYTS